MYEVALVVLVAYLFAYCGGVFGSLICLHGLYVLLCRCGVVGLW